MADNKSLPPAPVLIEASSLSEGYARIVLQICDHPGNTISPLCLTIASTGPGTMLVEDPPLRQALDGILKARSELDTETVAFTIFPDRYHRLSDNRQDFFEQYRDVFPRIRALDQRNSRGLYFQRLIMFGAGPYDGNQLEWIIRQYLARKGVRDSMFQAAIFDPGQDHTASAQLGFPCLQHVSFVPEDGGLVLNAFYATQQLLRKAYGNYLGLIRLGTFMAEEMGLEFTRLNVFVGVAKLDEIGKTTPEFAPVVAAARQLVKPTN